MIWKGVMVAQRRYKFVRLWVERDDACAKRGVVSLRMDALGGLVEEAALRRVERIDWVE